MSEGSLQPQYPTPCIKDGSQEDVQSLGDALQKKATLSENSPGKGGNTEHAENSNVDRQCSTPPAGHPEGSQSVDGRLGNRCTEDGVADASGVDSGNTVSPQPEENGSQSSALSTPHVQDSENGARTEAIRERYQRAQLLSLQRARGVLLMDVMAAGSNWAPAMLNALDISLPNLAKQCHHDFDLEFIQGWNNKKKHCFEPLVQHCIKEFLPEQALCGLHVVNLASGPPELAARLQKAVTEACQSVASTAQAAQQAASDAAAAGAGSSGADANASAVPPSFRHLDLLDWAGMGFAGTSTVVVDAPFDATALDDTGIDAAGGEGRASIVLLNNGIEGAEGLDTCADGIAKLLAPGGLAMVGGTSAHSLAAHLTIIVRLAEEHGLLLRSLDVRPPVEGRAAYLPAGQNLTVGVLQRPTDSSSSVDTSNAAAEEQQQRHAELLQLAKTALREAGDPAKHYNTARCAALYGFRCSPRIAKLLSDDAGNRIATPDLLRRETEQLAMAAELAHDSWDSIHEALGREERDPTGEELVCLVAAASVLRKDIDGLLQWQQPSDAAEKGWPLLYAGICSRGQIGKNLNPTPQQLMEMRVQEHMAKGENHPTRGMGAAIKAAEDGKQAEEEQELVEELLASVTWSDCLPPCVRNFLAVLLEMHLIYGKALANVQRCPCTRDGYGAAEGMAGGMASQANRLARLGISGALPAGVTEADAANMEASVLQQLVQESRSAAGRAGARDNGGNSGGARPGAGSGSCRWCAAFFGVERADHSPRACIHPYKLNCPQDMKSSVFSERLKALAVKKPAESAEEYRNRRKQGLVELGLDPAIDVP